MITWERSKRSKARPYSLDGTINDVLVYEIRASGVGRAYGGKDYELFMWNIAGKTVALGMLPAPAYLFDVDSWETGKELAEEHIKVVTAMLGLTMQGLGTSGGVPVTDELVERLADQAEAGYDLNDVVAELRTLLASFDEGRISLKDFIERNEAIKAQAQRAM